MSSFQIYDPKLHSFRALDTASTIDLPFDQVLLLNILIELKTLTFYLCTQDSDPPLDDPDEVRQSIVENL